MTDQAESRAQRIGGLIGEALTVIAAGALLGTLGAWTAVQIARLLLVLS